MKCKHKHECEKCIREEIASLEKKIYSLKEKLPAQTIQYIPYWPQYQPIYISPLVTIVPAIYSTVTTPSFSYGNGLGAVSGGTSTLNLNAGAGASTINAQYSGTSNGIQFFTTSTMGMGDEPQDPPEEEIAGLK